MGKDDRKDEWPRAGHNVRPVFRSVGEATARGGLSLEDFRQNEWLKYLEARARGAELHLGQAGSDDIEQAARDEFRRHRDSERKHAKLRQDQTVTDGNGRRVAVRDGRTRSTSDAFPSDSAWMFGQIRPDNHRHPKRSAPNRPQTPLQQLVARIVDEGLEYTFLAELSAHMKARALEDAALVRLYALMVSQAGFDTKTLQSVQHVDEDDMVRSGDNKKAAALLTEFGYPTSVRDVENCKRRLSRVLLEVGERMFSQMPLSKKSKE